MFPILAHVDMGPLGTRPIAAFGIISLIAWMFFGTLLMRMVPQESASVSGAKWWPYTVLRLVGSFAFLPLAAVLHASIWRKGRPTNDRMILLLFTFFVAADYSGRPAIQAVALVLFVVTIALARGIDALTEPLATAALWVLPTFQALVWFAFLASGDYRGSECSDPWCLAFREGVRAQPLQAYAILVYSVWAGLLWWWSRRRRIPTMLTYAYASTALLTELALYLARGHALETFRVTGPMMVTGIAVAVAVDRFRRPGASVPMVDSTRGTTAP